MQIPIRSAKRASSVERRFVLPRSTFESTLQVPRVRALALDSTSPGLSSVGITERLKPRLTVASLVRTRNSERMNASGGAAEAT